MPGIVDVAHLAGMLGEVGRAGAGGGIDEVEVSAALVAVEAFLARPRPEAAPVP